MYELDDLFDILKRNKITTNKESVRRWLRQGKIVGTKGGGPKKNGWQVSEEALESFLKERLPENVELKPTEVTTNVVLSEAEQEQLREEGRQEIFYRLAANHIWEGRFVFKKKFITDCLDHRRLENRSLRAYILNRIMEHKRGHATPGVVYILDTFDFEGNRLKFDSDFSGREEQIVFSLIEYLRNEYRDPHRRREGYE
ncbi:hypothetical protein [uncultured Planococcus sp.]|uniref:hypothetical protein n=1 Tax=uncultured Planococcus sp. TaxID=337815 RepID=UPI002606E915|nr:hypothetical protein [uncultured Planococcus sp.]